MGVEKDTLFRSADMSLTQLYIANEIGREVVSALGEVGEVQFRDVSSFVPRLSRQASICLGSRQLERLYWRLVSSDPLAMPRQQRDCG